MRSEEWPSILLTAIHAAENQKFKWGKNDCFIFCGEVARQMTGRDLFADYEFRGKYKTPRGALKLMRKYGFFDLKHIWDSFAQPIPVQYAGRGDIVMIDVDQLLPATGLVVDSRAAFLTKEGFTYHPLTIAHSAWRIE